MNTFDQIDRRARADECLRCPARIWIRADGHERRARRARSSQSAVARLCRRRERRVRRRGGRTQHDDLVRLSTGRRRDARPLGDLPAAVRADRRAPRSSRSSFAASRLSARLPALTEHPPRRRATESKPSSTSRLSPRIVELIAHEIEHIIEQLDGVDLRAKSRLRASGVRRVNADLEAYETTRAIVTGSASRARSSTTTRRDGAAMRTVIHAIGRHRACLAGLRS